MRLALRLTAIAIAIAGVVDPALARRETNPVAVEFRLAAESDPQHSRARAMRNAIERALGPEVVIGARLRPDAVIAIGNANIESVDTSRILSVPVPVQSGATIVAVEVPQRTIAGQRADLHVTIRGLRSAGHKSTVALEVQGAVLQTVEHLWGADDEPFDGHLSFAPPTAGVYRARIRVVTESVPDASVADALVVAEERPLRVLAYDPRPSWPVTFVRRSLEADTSFEIASNTRTSRPVSTRAGDAPRKISELHPDRYDLLIVGALEELREADLNVLERFVSRRGGTLLLLPDRQLPVAVRKSFNLPTFDEVLTEKPVEIQGANISLRASELLLASGSQAIPVAAVQQGNDTRAVVAAFNRGEGRVIVSGALDAWRYRAASDDAFGAFWRAVIADAALAAPPKLQITIEPAIARPGDPLTVAVALRATEFDPDASEIVLPAIAASLVDSTGTGTSVRLWQGARVGTLTGRLTAPAAGRYTLSASMDGASTTVPLLIADDVVHEETDMAAANAYAARATGGAVSSDPAEVARLVKAVAANEDERIAHPMRSWWWIVPFTGLLGAEWMLRRRSGLK